MEDMQGSVDQVENDENENEMMLEKTLEFEQSGEKEAMENEENLEGFEKSRESKKSAKSAKSAKSEKSEKSAKSGKSAKSEKNEKSAKNAKNEKKPKKSENEKNLAKNQNSQLSENPAKVHEISGEFYVQVLKASNLLAQESHSETFCVVFLSNNPTKIIKTPNTNNARNPEWKHIDKFVLNIEKNEIFDLQLVVQIFNFENGKTLIGENLYDISEIFEKNGEIKDIFMKLKNSEGEEGEFGEVSLLVDWVVTGGKAPDFNEFFFYF